MGHSIDKNKQYVRLFYAKIFLIFFMVLSIAFFSHPIVRYVSAQETEEDVSSATTDKVEPSEVTEIKNKIEGNSEKLKELEVEIQKYETQLVEVGKAKKTLSGAVRELDITRNKISTGIKATESRIGLTQSEITLLTKQISDKIAQVEKDKGAVAESIRKIDRLEDESLLETLLKHKNLLEFWEQKDSIMQFESGVRTHVNELLILTKTLEDDREVRESKVEELSGFKKQLSDEKVVLDVARKEKATILTVTQNQESKYQDLLKEKKDAHDKLEAEIAALESDLKFILDPSSIPRAGSGVLAFPFSIEYMNNCASFEKALKNTHCITQLFGNTSFARSGAYSGSGHNGIDFRTPLGTKIGSALSGRVVATGNTDLVRGCYSYGKWVLVEHQNGLSTLYAHLSVISATQGQALRTGDTVGYSGSTGYSTGPHLHFSVFATKGVQVTDLGSWYKNSGRAPTTACSKGGAVIPVAAYSAYLNPLDYLL